MNIRYKQLAEILKENIRANMKVGDKLYPQRELMKRYGLSSTTIDKALKLLYDEGLIASVHGKGTFVSNLGKQTNHSAPAKTIFVVTDYMGPGMFKDYYYAGIYDGIKSALTDGNLSTMYVNLDSNGLEEKMSEHRCDGVVLLALTDAHRKEVEMIESRKIPAVLVGAQWPGINIPLVDSDNEDGMYGIAEHLAGKGHKRVGYVSPSYSTTHAVIRRQAFLQALAKFGLCTKEDWNIKVGFSALSDDNKAQLRRIFDSDNRPTALVFSSFHAVTITMMTELRAMGLRIPEDVSLTGFDDPSWTACTDPALTVIEQPLFEIGRHAVSNLLNQIEGSLFVRKEILSVRMVERASVATCGGG